MEALHSEIERLRRMKDECGKLSRSNKRKLKRCKSELRNKLGAAVIYPEDRQHVPQAIQISISFALKDIDHILKNTPGCMHDGRLFRLLCDIFGFEVTEATIARYYYMSDKNRELGK
ncbi:hypothetical protein [uncultured Parabacteroides sp.]|uniref:hypothetical protein n=1 Tax=uncultured Parabacteroides sp. TaxID=512312 RepID=UPI0025D648F2|nr:hypothetical protein [uncultured Parabacteroides sp.]